MPQDRPVLNGALAVVAQGGPAVVAVCTWLTCFLPCCVLHSGKSRALFCYDCLVPFTPTPSLRLPFQLHIITHTAERLTKATGVHAAVLCRGQVHLQRCGSCARSPPATAATTGAS